MIHMIHTGKPKRNCTVPIQFPAHVRRQLDALKREGFTNAGFVRRAVERELARGTQMPNRPARRSADAN